MKNDCNVVRDLMPLVIDGAASEESAQIVEEHVAECENCAQIYSELQAALPASDSARESADFIKAAKIVRTWKLVKRIVAALLILSLLTGAAYTGWYFWDRNDRAKRARLDVPGVELYLVRTRENRVYLLYNPNEFGECLRFNLWHGHLTEYQAMNSYNGPNINKWMKEYDFCFYPLGDWVNGQIGDTEETVLHALYIISPEDTAQLSKKISNRESIQRYLVYSEGQDIPLCSPELEAYYAAEDAEMAKALYESVPEFQTK